MTLAELILAFQNGATQQNNTLTSASLTALQSYLGRNGLKLRVFAARGLRPEQQASTVGIVRRFIALGFKGEIQLIYDNTPGQTPPGTLEQLAQLLPGLQPANPQPLTIGKATVSFWAYVEGKAIANLAKDPQPLCVSGGAALTTNPAAYFNVAYYLQLQPFLDPAGAEQLWKAGDTTATDLTKVASLGGAGQFVKRAYYTDTPPLTAADWTALGRVPNIDPEMLKRATVLATAATTAAPQAINLLPVAGLYPGQGPQTLAGSNLDLVVGLIASVATAANQKLLPQRPTVIALLTAFGGSEARFWSELQEFFASLDSLDTIDFSKLPLADQKRYRTKKWLKDQGITLTSKNAGCVLLANAQSAAELTASLKQAGKGLILLTALPAAPPLLADYLFSIASLPGVVAGAAGSNLAVNLGKPYLQLAGPAGAPYPSKLLAMVDEAVPAGISTQLLNLSNGVSRDAEKAFGEVAQLFGALLKAGSPEGKFFADLRAYFHQDQHDKLLLAVLYWFNRYQPATEKPNPPAKARKALAVANDDPLLALYTKLQANLSGDTLNLIPGALKDGALVSYLSGLIGGKTLSVQQASITKTDSQVIVKGQTANFIGVSLPLSVVFSLNEDGTTLDATPTLTLGTTTLPGVPWFELQACVVAVTVPSNGNRISGQAALDIKVGATTLHLTSSFPTADNQLLLDGLFGTPAPSVESVFQLLGGLDFVRALPAQVSGPASLGLQQMQLAYDYAATPPAIDSFNLSLKTTKPWQIIGKLVLGEILFDVVVAAPTGSRRISWTASSTLAIGAGQVDVALAYPNLSLTGELAPDSKPIALGDLFTFFLPASITLNLGANLTALSLNVSPGQNGTATVFQLSAALDTPAWNVSANGVRFGLTNLAVDLANGDPSAEADDPTNPDGLTAKLAATTALFEDDPALKVTFDLVADYLGKGKGWKFSGKQTGNSIKVKQILTKYVSPLWDTPLVPDLDLSELAFAVTVGGGTDSAKASEYTVSGTLEAWPTPLGSFTKSSKGVKIKALMGYKEGETGRYGQVRADVKWNSIQLMLAYDFDPKVQAFSITWGKLKGLIEKKTMPDGSTHQMARLTFTESTTLGSIIETCVSWATGSKFGLGAPWNLLDEVPLNNLELVYDFTAKTVSFKVGIGPIELGFATINGIGVSYQSNQPKKADNGVKVSLEGSFSWLEDSKSLDWDAAKPETTPAPAGQGNKYFDLRMLALGQHVALGDLKEVNKVQDAIDMMTADLPELTPDNPALPAVQLDANSSWLIGMDFGVLRLDKEESKAPEAFRTLQGPTATGEYVLADEAADEADAEAEAEDDEDGYFIKMQIVFNDPNLYALRLALDGAPAKIFKGLDFQILYKKVSDTVGVYMAEITLPDVMRQLKLGTVNITLPVFAIQVYTNGDFLVDIGFPWNQNFARSLTFQTIIITPVGIPIPVMGSVGLYFGKLSSATTDRVPVSTRGTFNPVLVFGFGLQFGVGYSFEAGILKAGFSLTAIAILEGLLAKWNPYKLAAGPTDNNQLETAYYFWFRGTVGIVGKLYGSVDFAIIKAELNIDLSIIAQFTFAAYQPIVLSITASVDVGLTLTINLGFFKIHISLSFSARISQSVTIQASGGTAPWADGSPAQLLRQRQRPLLLVARRLADAPFAPKWSNLNPAAAPVPLKAALGLGLTMAGDAARTPAEQAACYVSMLFIESVPPPQTRPLLATGRALAEQAAAADTSFELLCKMLFRWAVAAVQPAPLSSADVDNCVVTDAQLKQLLEYLSDRKNPLPLDYDTLTKFFAGQFALTVSTGQTAGEQDATYFPMPDELSFSRPAYGSTPALSYAYGQYNQLAPDYVSQLASYFDELAVVQQQEQAAATLTSAPANARLAMSSFVFADYFLLLCRQMVQAGRDALRDFKYALQATDTPATIAVWAQHNGVPGYSVCELFADNAGLALNPAAGALVIGGSYYLVQATDTFTTIAQQPRYGQGFGARALALANQDTTGLLRPGAVVQYPAQAAYPVQPGQTLADVAQALSVSPGDLVDKGNVLTLNGLLLPAVPLAVPLFNYSIAADDTLRGVAARFGITVVELARPAANANIQQLFDPSVPTIDLVELAEFKVGAILDEIKLTQGFQHLSGMTSRYYLAGLRLPTAGITPQVAGMWVQNAGGKLALPDYAGLYALTGQQFVLPTLANAPLDLTFASATGWLQFAGPTPQQAIVTIAPGDSNAARIASVQAAATAGPLDVGLTYLGAAPAFRSELATYPLTSAIVWSSAGPVAMPYDGAPAGLPALKLWQLPDTLLQLPGSTRAIAPRMQPRVGQYNSATGAMDKTDVQHYGYATVVEFTIKRIPVVGASPATQTTYEIAGADGTNADLLEQLVAGVGADDSKIASLFVAYSVGGNAATPQGIQTDDPQFLTMGVAQVNMSTDTHPSQLFLNQRLEDEALEAAPAMRLLNKPTGLLALLWEASITRAGGFYLYYYNAQSGAGLPNGIFNSDQEATVRLVVLHANPGAAVPAQQNQVASYMNALATAQALDTSHAVLFAEAAPLPVQLKMSASRSWTLAALAEAYFDNVADVATNNKAHALKAGIELRVPEGTYEVSGSGPGGDLTAIANYFATTPDAIKKANPLRTDWPTPLPLFTSLRLPALLVTVGQAKGGNTLAALAAYYGHNLGALAAFNQDVAGIFADDTASTNVVLAGGPRVRSATVPAGTVPLEATRPVPPAVPDDPAAPGFATAFLLNNFSLLGSQLLENEGFRRGPVGLPAGPTSPTAPASHDKIRQPRVQAPGESWTYRQSIPYSRFAKATVSAPAGLPSLADSPYRGLGNLLKVNFTWLDYYGNQLITTLSQPVAGSGSVPNQPPVLTGYTDPLLGLNQWPSVSASWRVKPTGTGLAPELAVPLTFDDSPYQGLYLATATDAHTVVARFTQPLDPTQAQKTDNYTLVQLSGPDSATGTPVSITGITLKTEKDDTMTVTLSVSALVQDANQPLRLTVGNLPSADGKRTFSGVATFYYAAEAQPGTSPVTDSARRDQQVYRQLWHQLKDPNGIRLSFATSLLSKEYTLTAAQMAGLVDSWLASVYLFLDDRAQGQTTVASPASQYVCSFPIDLAQLNPAQIFRLELSLRIERTGGAVAGDFETTGGVKQVSTSIAPASSQGAKDKTFSFAVFAEQFEQAMQQAMQQAGQVALRVASGLDRTASNRSTGSQALWAVRQSHKPGLAYEITNAGHPDLFAPAPISNQLQSRTQVPIYPFVPFNPSDPGAKCGIDFSKPARFLDFNGIDMDQWGRQFFAAIDHVLSPEYTASIQLVDYQQQTTYYADILQNKVKLAEIVKHWLIPVFKQASQPAPDATAVQEAFRQALLVQLSNAYTTNAAVQFAATVAAEVPTEDIAPRLYGTVNTNFRFLGATPGAASQLLLYFNSAPEPGLAANPASYTLTPALKVLAATVDTDNPRIVNLKLSGDARVGTTTVAISPVFTDAGGMPLVAPFSQPVTADVEAGNFSSSVAFTSPKLSLQPAAGLPLAFLVTSPQVVKDDDGTILPYLDLDLSFAGAQIEHQLEKLMPASDYLASSWLSLMTTDGSEAFAKELGKFRVPLLLRSFPTMPALLAQQGQASDPLTENLAKLLNWNYTITYSEPLHFPQDKLTFTVNFNVQTNPLVELLAMRDAFGPLAEFITVYPDVAQALTSTLAKIDATTTDKQVFDSAAVALQSFKELVDRIIVAADGTYGQLLAETSALRVSNAVQPYTFDVQEGNVTIAGVDALLISISPSAPAGIGALTVKLDGYTTKAYSPKKPTGKKPATAPAADPGYAYYFVDAKGVPLSAALGQQQPQRTIELSDMNVLNRQDAETAVELRRNVELIKGMPSADAFVYRTGQIGFAGPLHPTITSSNSIDISTLGASPARPHNQVALAQHLANLLDALLDKNSQPTLSVQMNCSYDYPLGSGMSTISLPVMMQPLTLVQVLPGSATPPADTTRAQLVTDWATAMLTWFRNYLPSSQGASFQFNLTVFSNLTEQPLPLLRLTNLGLPVQYISNLGGGS